MPTARESLGNQKAIQATLDAGIEQISQDEEVVFTRYTKFVLWPDSSVFWIATTATLTVKGSLHYATDRNQSEDETLAANQVILTAEQEVTAFNETAPDSMWIGTWPVDGGTLQVVFGQRGGFYDQAQIWHYSGFAVYPAMSTQIVASAADVPEGPIVSNSLPIWLAQNAMAPVYPSFLVPDNIRPPYIVAHVERTETLGAFPVLGPWPGTIIPDSGAAPLHALASSQLMRDEVQLTLYGFTNQMAVQFFSSLVETSVVDESFGFANSPAIQDAKRTQREIASLAQKKTIGISANYYQGAADAAARRLILSALLGGITILGGTSRFGQAAAVQAPQIANATGTVPG